MKQSVLFCIGLLIIISSCKKDLKPKISIDLEPIYQSYMEDYFALYPFQATFFGVEGYNDKINMTVYPDYISRGIEFTQKYLDTLNTIDLNEISAEEQLNVKILQYQLKMEHDLFQDSVNFYRPVTSDLASFPQQFARMASGNSIVSFENEKDYRDFMERIKAFSKWSDQAIITMRRGLELGKTVPKGPMMDVPGQLRPFIETPLQSHDFYEPLKVLPEEMDSLSKKQLVEVYSAIIMEEAIPSYRKLYDFIIEEYLPGLRSEAGLVHYPDGNAQYKSILQYFTSTDMTPEEIHELGLNEVARIRMEMDSIKRTAGFDGELKEFFNYVKTDPKFFPFETREEVLNRFSSYKDTLNNLLNDMFNLRPKATFEMNTNSNFANDGAYYEPPAVDGSRPGTFFVLMNNAPTYNTINMKSLFLHEAIPGHHFQLALQQEMELPDFRKYYYYNAFIEGWGLYAESLGKELDFFNDPYEYLGKLNWEMMRAVRMVVDTGIHSKGWTREQAIDYMLDYVPIDREFAKAEIDRYIIWQGQAVGYKVGELKIQELKHKAKKRLSSNFELSEFHDLLLVNGSVPLAILEEIVNSWIDKKLKDLGQNSSEITTG